MNSQRNRRREAQPKANVIQKGNDMFLCVNNEWFVYSVSAQPVGSGAMGTVYLGRSCSTHEKVAIKRVNDAYSNLPGIRERARLEASLLFRHRNLVEMIGYCECNPYNGPIFIISRLVSGITLDEHVSLHLRNRPDFVEKICQSVFPVMDALDYLHAKNILHMDIKPSNIMIENGSNIRLMDLGIAFASHNNTGGSIPGSGYGSGLGGTPQYAAPEQMSRDKEAPVAVNKTTDIYELGMTLYELLAGNNPFDCPTIEETLEKQKHAILPAIPGVPEEVMHVIWKATEKEQKKRYQAVRDFKDDLQRAIIVVTPWWKDLLRNPYFVGGVIGFILVLVLLILTNIL